MASLYKKVISGKPYWYLREMGWVDGKPKLVSERYLGTAADIAALGRARGRRPARADPPSGVRGRGRCLGSAAGPGRGRGHRRGHRGAAVGRGRAGGGVHGASGAGTGGPPSPPGRRRRPGGS